MLGQLGHHALDVGVLLVDLVDRHDDRHVGRSRMVDRLDRLGHHAVVGGHHQHDDIGDLSAAGPHLRKRSVTGRVDEGDLAAFAVHHVGADVLALQRLTMLMYSQLSEGDRKTFEALNDKKDTSGMQQFIKEKVPNLEQLTQEAITTEINAFKEFRDSLPNN